MSIFGDMNVISSADTIAFNTNTLFDLQTGSYMLGVNNEWYLNGGLSPHINVFGAPNSNFKSTMANSLIMRSIGIYDKSECIINDTENSLDKDKFRAINMAEEFSDRIDPSQILWLKGIDYDLDNFDKFIREYCENKEKQKKDMMVETPFIDVKTLKPLKTWIPTYIFCDSLSELSCKIEEEAIDAAMAKGLCDSSANTIAMIDGNKKTMFNRAMRRRCQTYGLVFVCTGHYDKIVQMNPYDIAPKETPFAKQDWKLKRCGSNIKFLASNYTRTQAHLLVDSNKKAMYAQAGGTSDKDIHQVDTVLERCKVNNAGEITPYICSQSYGLLNATSNYHYLKLNEFYGMTGNTARQQLVFLPDITLTRNTIRDIAEANDEVRRALEICAQLCYIKNNWNINDLKPYDFSITPTELFEKLNSDKNKNVVKDILQSRGYWTYSKNEQPYMSLFKILDLAKAIK